MMETTYVALDDMEVRSDDDRHYIEGIAVPWGRRTDRVAVPECFDRGAFSDLVTSGAKVKLTDYNHSRERVPVGYSTAVEDRADGLWMRFRLNRTPEGESAHANTLDGVYGGLSIGFIARTDEMRGGVRHVKSARLDHVSLVEVPAYEDAVITAMRSALADELLQWREIAAPRKLAIDMRDRESQTLLMAKFRR
jgi:Escherichia/Staphylococcus phage prohead protease